MSEFASVAADMRTSEIGTSYSTELANAPKRRLRGKTYFFNGHRGYPCSGPTSNRSEEHLAIALWRWCQKSGIQLPNGEEIFLVDYQVPLRASRLDERIGKIDLFGLVESLPSVFTGKVCELKVKGRETPLKALLECLAYRAIAEANLEDFSIELEKNITNLECVVLAPREYWDAFRGPKGSWAHEIKLLARRIEVDLGFKFSFLALENCKWTMGLNGAAPILICAPRIRDAI